MKNSKMLQELQKKQMTKKKLREQNSAHRVLIDFNTGTRTMEDKRFPSRQQLKRQLQEECR